MIYCMLAKLSASGLGIYVSCYEAWSLYIEAFLIGILPIWLEVLASFISKYEPKEKLEAISQDHFCYVRNAFPGSLKETAKLRTPDFIPSEFDLKRGDALLYVAKVRNFFLLGLGAWLILSKNKFVFSPGIKKRFRKLRETSTVDIIYT